MAASRDLSKRVQGFTESAIREVTRVSNEHAGINLAQGMPNFPPPPALVAAAHRALSSLAELDVIADVCRRHDLLAITDEIDEHIVHDGLVHTPIATLPLHEAGRRLLKLAR